MTWQKIIILTHYRDTFITTNYFVNTKKQITKITDKTKARIVEDVKSYQLMRLFVYIYIYKAERDSL